MHRTLGLDKNTRAGLPECVVSTMAGALPEITQDTTQAVPECKLKFLTSPGIEPAPPSWKAGFLSTTQRRTKPYLSNVKIVLRY